MTGPEMNAPIRKFAAALSVAAAMAGLTACAGAFDPQTDPRSPVAERVQALVDANREYPRWADFPRSTDPEPAPAQIAAQVTTLNAASGTLAAEIARIEWTATGDPVAWAQAVQARVDAVPVAPVTQNTAAEIVEFARQTRERGRAPPPIPRR
ncbi:hypothetical protein N0B44_20080 [Roseibacterium beibuensis]|uniref:hypothetical protein n=1 Tax=[Roseibacterium] beibuensis TaxID=1193142 RepID=UPI00217E1624|nr:hypothetical protein [Roseibacterium beibuensis]MCS6625215.1 hypothetical protein [Roseibacterium beibuensis]